MEDFGPLERKPYKRLSREEFSEVLRLRKDGIAVSALADQFQISERQLHRLLKSQIEGSPLLSPSQGSAARARQLQGSIQQFHSAWIYEELITNPRVPLDNLVEGLKAYFGLEVSTSTVWRHIRGGGLENQGFPGFTRMNEDKVD
jgi:transposase